MGAADRESDMTPQEISRRFEVAQTLAIEGGQLARSYFLGHVPMEIEKKGQQDWTTTADRAVEQSIFDAVQKIFPSDQFFGEEQGGSNHDVLWVTDPIDGTTNFLRGRPDWCISIAFVLNGELEFGVVHDPMHDDHYAALRGGGATRNGASIRVSGRSDLREALVALGFSYRRGVEAHAALVQQLLSAECEYRRTGSGALGMAHVADGRLDGYAELHINSWDVLGGIALVREAGGWTSDFLSGDWLTAGNPILAATPGIREALADVTGLGEGGNARRST